MGGVLGNVMDDNLEDGNAFLASRSMKRAYALHIAILIDMPSKMAAK